MYNCIQNCKFKANKEFVVKKYVFFYLSVAAFCALINIIKLNINKVAFKNL